MTMPTVLVVDDDPGIRLMLSEVLTLEGYAVQTAVHGGLALDILRTSTEGMVVLLGLAMPEVDGEMILEAVAADKELASRHIFIMVTGSRQRAASGRVAALREALGVPFLPKPIEMDQLFDAVEAAARRLASRRTQA